MELDLEQLIKHPQTMNKETLYELRSLIALYPYFQTARLLMLQNLYILHDPSFNEELTKAAIYLTDRRVIFNLIEAVHYKLKKSASGNEQKSKQQNGDRTISLIDNFLDTIPQEEEDKDEQEEPKRKKRKLTAADAAIDYVSFLLDSENEDDNNNESTEEAPQMKGQSLIDNFINNDNGKIELKEEPEYIPEAAKEPKDNENMVDGSYYTETLARIYIQQGRFEKALEIITHLNLIFPKKNAYFADQIRFLQKLILNSKAKDSQQNSK